MKLKFLHYFLLSRFYLFLIICLSILLVMFCTGYWIIREALIPVFLFLTVQLTFLIAYNFALYITLMQNLNWCKTSSFFPYIIWHVVFVWKYFWLYFYVHFISLDKHFCLKIELFYWPISFFVDRSIVISGPGEKWLLYRTSVFFQLFFTQASFFSQTFALFLTDHLE